MAAMEEKGNVHVEDAPNYGRDHAVDQEYGEKKDFEYASEDIQQQAQILESPENSERVRKYMWKLDCIILPTISALYFFEYLGEWEKTRRCSTELTVRRPW